MKKKTLKKEKLIGVPLMKYSIYQLKYTRIVF